MNILHSPLFQNLEILPLDQHIIYRKSSFMWKLAHNMVPHTLASNFTLPRLDYAKQYVTFSGVQLWNSKIPNDLKSLTTFKLFCKKCESWLLDTLH